MDDSRRELVLRRLRRIAGQVEGLKRMVSEDRYCIDILRQISSAQQALNGVAREIMDNHLRVCTVRAMSSDEPAERDRAIEEILETVYSIRKR